MVVEDELRKVDMKADCPRKQENDVNYSKNAPGEILRHVALWRVRMEQLCITGQPLAIHSKGKGR
jgi:hypothetical protein